MIRLNASASPIRMLLQPLMTLGSTGMLLNNHAIKTGCVFTAIY